MFLYKENKLLFQIKNNVLQEVATDTAVLEQDSALASPQALHSLVVVDPEVAVTRVNPQLSHPDPHDTPDAAATAAQAVH